MAGGGIREGSILVRHHIAHPRITLEHCRIRWNDLRHVFSRPRPGPDAELRPTDSVFTRLQIRIYTIAWAVLDDCTAPLSDCTVPVRLAEGPHAARTPTWWIDGDRHRNDDVTQARRRRRREPQDAAECRAEPDDRRGLCGGHDTTGCRPGGPQATARALLLRVDGRSAVGARSSGNRAQPRRVRTSAGFAETLTRPLGSEQRSSTSQLSRPK